MPGTWHQSCAATNCWSSSQLGPPPQLDPHATAATSTCNATRADLLLGPVMGICGSTWAPPYALPLADHQAASNTPRPQEHHTFKMLQEMLISIRRDLQEQILSRRPRRARLPDSTTGMSSVVLDVGALLDSARDIGQSQDGRDYDDP